MSHFRRYLWALALLTLSICPASAQLGIITGHANSLMTCSAFSAGTPELRPEGYSELLGDILISCTGGPPSPVGATVPTVNLVAYISPAVPVTSRLLGPGINGSSPSEAMLIIDDAGANLTTGATGGYGPQAPQSLCTTAQQLTQSGSACAAQVALDKSGQYHVAVVPGTSTPAKNVFQGSVGDFGFNSIAFYNVPVLPPAYAGLSRTFRITNIRIPTVAGVVNSTAQALLVASPNQILPLVTQYQTMNLGVLGPSMSSNVKPIAGGGGTSSLSCTPQASPTLIQEITFTEGFATGFKTRVVAGGPTAGIPNDHTGNVMWAAEAQNLASPSNQNIPGGFYGGYIANNESGFIVPGATFTSGNIQFVAGLADFGTRLKAVFTNLPAGVTLYASTTSTGTVTIPGGTSLTPYAVLTALNFDGVGDWGDTFTPLTSSKTGSDGLFVLPLSPDPTTGITAAIWEVVNANPSTDDSLTFGVYAACAAPVNFSPPVTTLSLAPEPGGGMFSAVNDTYGLTEPVPRFGSSPCATSGCSLNASTNPLLFTYTIGGALPQSQYVQVTAVPSTLAVGVEPVVTFPIGGSWLAASLGSDGLYVSVAPEGLLPSSSNTYTGYVELWSQAGMIQIPVFLTVNPRSSLSIAASHSGNFAAGQLGATYTVTVSNNSGTATSGIATVTRYPVAGLSIVSMASPGSAWTCNTNTCTIATTLAPGQAYPPITVTVNVAPDATSLSTLTTVSNGASSSSPAAIDPITVTPLACTVTGDSSPSVADLQMIISQALGTARPTYDFTADSVANVADIQVVANAVLGNGCK